MSVIVIGGGIAGLGVARLLAREGIEVTLLDAAREPGGLGATFEVPGGARVDCFYHCILPTDSELLTLLRELGLESRLSMSRGPLGFIYQGRHFPLGAPLDLLRFEPLGLVDRIRVGLLALGASSREARWDLDRTTAVEWLGARVGPLAIERLWRPLLEAKFGDKWDRVPALWLHSTLAREKNGDEEIKGVVLGGLEPILRGLLAELLSLRVRVVAGARVEGVSIGADGVTVDMADGTELRASRVVFATPITAAQRILQKRSVTSCLDGLSFGHQGVVCGVFLLDRSLGGWYWTAVVDSGVPFQGVVDMSVLRPPSDVGGHHIAYVMNYTHRDSPVFQRDAAATLAEYQSGLERLYPQLRGGGIKHAYLFKAPEVEPLWSPGYLDRRPPIELIPSRVYLATTSQVYPGVTSFNSSLTLARHVSEWVLARERNEKEPARPCAAALV